MSGTTRRASVTKDRRRARRPWRVDLHDTAGHVHRTRWFTVHANALRWATKKARA